MKFTVIFIFAITCIKVSATQNLPNGSASISPFITQRCEILSCPAQQQRETALSNFRNEIASALNKILHSCERSVLTTPAFRSVRECGLGNWTRVAYLNMSDPMQSCPQAWGDRSANGVRVCGRPIDSYRGCHSICYHTDHSYTTVCGQVFGYQLGTPDGFIGRSTFPISEAYVDGVSITHGSPRSHIWTYAADWNEAGNGCPCKAGGNSAPPFVGNNYYCESGYSGSGYSSFILLTSDPLWDGAGCASEGSCCSTAPWFTVDLVNPTSDDIEVRICFDSSRNDEDAPIHLLELYIQ